MDESLLSEKRSEETCWCGYTREEHTDGHNPGVEYPGPDKEPPSDLKVDEDIPQSEQQITPYIDNDGHTHLSGGVVVPAGHEHIGTLGSLDEMIQFPVMLKYHPDDGGKVVLDGVDDCSVSMNQARVWHPAATITVRQLSDHSMQAHLIRHDDDKTNTTRFYVKTAAGQ